MKKNKKLEEILETISIYKPIVILGKPGPTGKTSLYNKLKEKGYNVIEISEDISDFVNYNDDKNHFIEKEYYNVFILNKLVK